MDALNIVDPLKFGLGFVFLAAGLVALWMGRSERGLGQRRQIGALLVIGAAVFFAVGLGLIGR